MGLPITLSDKSNILSGGLDGSRRNINWIQWLTNTFSISFN